MKDDSACYGSNDMWHSHAWIKTRIANYGIFMLHNTLKRNVQCTGHRTLKARICKAEFLKYGESRSYYSNITTSISKYVELWHNVKFLPIIISITVNCPPPVRNYYCPVSSGCFLSSKLNMVETDINMNDEIIACLTHYRGFNSTFNCLSDPDCVEGMALRCEVLKRHFVNIGIWPAL